MNLTYTDWLHEAFVNEQFDHSCLLNTYFVRPVFIYCLSDKLNIYINSTLGIRQMYWDGKKESIHHRDETSLTDYGNAQGSILGDSRLIFRSIIKNTDTGKGFRIYINFCSNP